MYIDTALVSRDNVHMDMLIFLSRIRSFIEAQRKSRGCRILFPAQELYAGMASFNNPSIGFFSQSDVMLIPFNKINAVKLIKKDSPGNFPKLQKFFIGQFENTFHMPQRNN